MPVIREVFPYSSIANRMLGFAQFVLATCEEPRFYFFRRNPMVGWESQTSPTLHLDGILEKSAELDDFRNKEIKQATLGLKEPGVEFSIVVNRHISETSLNSNETMANVIYGAFLRHYKIDGIPWDLVVGDDRLEPSIR